MIRACYKRGSCFRPGLCGRVVQFRIASYQWLVVAGAKAQFKGSGQINNAGNYGFMLTAIDGALPGGGGQDKFRIKITDASGNSVYDNQLGASDTSDPTTVLGGGSIVIHSSNQLLNEPLIEGANLAPLTLQEVQPIEEEAIRLWVAAGAKPASFKDVALQIVDLPGSGLGLTAADTIWLDKDAAGHGWFVDPTPADGRTELIPFYAAGKVDLLTVMAHELGHILGYDDSGTDGLMAEYLGIGVRRLPTPTDSGAMTGHTLLALTGGLALNHLAKDAGTPLMDPAVAPGALVVGALPAAGSVQVPPALPLVMEVVPVRAKPRDSALVRSESLTSMSPRVRDAVFAELADQPLLKELGSIDSK